MVPENSDFTYVNTKTQDRKQLLPTGDRPSFGAAGSTKRSFRASNFDDTKDIRGTSKGAPGEMSREIVPKEFINFL